MARNFRDLSEREIVALAIALEEEEDGRIYGDFVDGLRDTYPASAELFRGDAAVGVRNIATACLIFIGSASANISLLFGDKI